MIGPCSALRSVPSFLASGQTPRRRRDLTLLPPLLPTLRLAFTPSSSFHPLAPPSRVIYTYTSLSFLPSLSPLFPVATLSNPFHPSLSTLCWCTLREVVRRAVTWPLPCRRLSLQPGCCPTLSILFRRVCTHWLQATAPVSVFMARSPATSFTICPAAKTLSFSRFSPPRHAIFRR